jgi:hypothetical protein
MTAAISSTFGGRRGGAAPCFVVGDRRETAAWSPATDIDRRDRQT